LNGHCAACIIHDGYTGFGQVYQVMQDGYTGFEICAA
jgi:hypothetical protein